MKAGLSEHQFRKSCHNGFGDGNNAYAHSMAWFNNHLFVGTTRANLCLIRHSMKQVNIDIWPVECPYPVYSPDFEKTQARAEIWRYSPGGEWKRVFQAPMVLGSTGEWMSRDLGYRGMVVFRGPSDDKPALYVSSWSRSRGNGPVILRTDDGETFTQVGEAGLMNLPVTSLRLLVPFKGRLFTAPTGSAKGNPNTSGVTLICESRDPRKGKWHSANEPGFGDPENSTIFEMRGFAGYLYAGTVNNNGFQIWRTRAKGSPPYDWEMVIERGAGRGSLNQIPASMIVFKNALYIGTGIQNGGYDHLNDIGPAGSEVIRLNKDGSWEVIVGEMRSDGMLPTSGLSPGFNCICNGYFWRMGIHEGWLYLGTLDWRVILPYVDPDRLEERFARIMTNANVDEVVKHQAGCEVWRTQDGDNWVPVTVQGFGNPYNYGIRNIVSTPYGVFIGTANPFGSKVATKFFNKKGEGEWIYKDNPLGGLEVWHGSSGRFYKEG